MEIKDISTDIQINIDYIDDNNLILYINDLYVPNNT